MGKEVFEKLGHPLDSDISWRINGYDSGAEKELEELGRKKGVLGVCHEVSVDVGGVVVSKAAYLCCYPSCKHRLDSGTTLGKNGTCTKD
jgi:hypothetical protein